MNGNQEIQQSKSGVQIPKSFLQNKWPLAYRKLVLIGVGVWLFIIIGVLFAVHQTKTVVGLKSFPLWPVRSIDTVKYSRDLAREKLNDPAFDKIIDQQVKEIAAAGASHVAIDTPYDPEFLPILKRWVSVARRNHLHVWFRGNFSGWERWFGYQAISRDQHTQMTRDFILNNPDLFADGDIFTACPECENGGPGDPRKTDNLASYRQFLISEYQITQAAFTKINKKVASNYNSMNGDVARLVMDKDTTIKLGGVVVVDHYVKTPEQLISDVNQIAKVTGGKVVLGEFGAPIPDIHGPMTEAGQAFWLSQVLQRLAADANVIGLNYWVNVGSSTQLWDNINNPRAAVLTLRNYYTRLRTFD